MYIAMVLTMLACALVILGFAGLKAYKVLGFSYCRAFSSNNSR